MNLDPLIPRASHAIAGAAVLFLACAVDHHVFDTTREKEDVVFANIEGRWEGKVPDGEVSLDLCEAENPRERSKCSPPPCDDPGYILHDDSQPATFELTDAGQYVSVERTGGCGFLRSSPTGVHAYFDGVLSTPVSVKQDTSTLLVDVLLAETDVDETDSGLSNKSPFELPYAIGGRTMSGTMSARDEIKLQVLTLYRGDGSSVTYENVKLVRTKQGCARADAATEAGAK